MNQPHSTFGSQDTQEQKPTQSPQNESQVQSQSVPPAEETTPEVEPEPEVQDEPELDDVSTDRSNQGMFSWRDVALVHQFAIKYGKQSQTFQEFFQSLIGVYGDAIDVAEGLYPPAGVTYGIDFIEGMAINDATTPTEAMRHGIRLAAELGEMEVEDIRSISKMINSILEYYAQDNESITIIRYRRNMPTDEVLSLFMEAIENISEEGVRSFKQAQELLQIWPLGNV